MSVAISLSRVSTGNEEKTFFKEFSCKYENAWKSGQLIIVAGPSGCGKSTLLELVAKLPRDKFEYGGDIAIALEGKDEGNNDPIEETFGDLTHTVSPDAKVGIVFQEGALIDDLTVGENLQFGKEHGKKRGKEHGKKRPFSLSGWFGERWRSLREWGKGLVDRIFRRLSRPSEDSGAGGDSADPASAVERLQEEVRTLSHKNCTKLSGGQKRRVALVRTLRFKADVILFDEPTVGLDPRSATMVADCARELASRPDDPKLVIVVTHELHYFKTKRNEGEPKTGTSPKGYFCITPPVRRRETPKGRLFSRFVRTLPWMQPGTPIHSPKRWKRSSNPFAPCQRKGIPVRAGNPGIGGTCCGSFPGSI